MEAAVAIDLQDWIVSIESNTFGIRPDQFFVRFGEEYFKELLDSTVPEKLTQSFQDLSLSVSLLKSLSFENKDIIKQLESIISESFPPILMLMNLNGTLIHRTDKRVEFIKK